MERRKTGEAATAAGAIRNRLHFVLNAIYGADVITNFSGADTVSLSTAEYSQLSAAISGGNYAGGNATLSFSDGDALTFKGLTQASLTALSSHFTSDG